jgi:hypothetical protein
MKPSLILILLGSALLVLAASGATPTPKPTPKASASPTLAPKTSSSNARVEPSPTPQPSPTPEKLPSPTEMQSATAEVTPANATPPKPVLYLMRTEPFSTGGKNFIRYRYDVANKSEYPAEMFAAAPSLPPCGSNTNASRTWVDFFDSTGKRIYGFCALSKPADLGLLWIAFEEGVIPPSYVYIELNDRQTNTKYKSNLADTAL